jgi:hypothetical protein
MAGFSKDMKDEYIFDHKDNQRTAVARNFFVNAQGLSSEDEYRLQQFSQHLNYAPKDVQGFGMFSEVPGSSSCYTLVATDKFWSFFQSIITPNYKYSVKDIMSLLVTVNYR